MKIFNCRKLKCRACSFKQTNREAVHLFLRVFSILYCRRSDVLGRVSTGDPSWGAVNQTCVHSLFSIYFNAIMYILIQTYTSHNSSINKTTKTNEKGYTEKERKTNHNKKLRSLAGKSKNIELTKLNWQFFFSSSVSNIVQSNTILFNLFNKKFTFWLSFSPFLYMNMIRSSLHN